MHVVIAAILGLALVSNGLVMLLAPASWYSLVPGVAATGPFNPHFVRDIGAAYLVAGGALTAFAFEPRARAAAQAAAVFLAVHALIHLWDAAAGREHAHQLLIDLPTVFLPPAVAIWLAFRPRRGATPDAMSKEKHHDEMVHATLDR
jgi:uncharacterized protein YjeT (DUF2065 family)